MTTFDIKKFSKKFYNIRYGKFDHKWFGFGSCNRELLDFINLKSKYILISMPELIVIYEFFFEPSIKLELNNIKLPKGTIYNKDINRLSRIKMSLLYDSQFQNCSFKEIVVIYKTLCNYSRVHKIHTLLNKSD